MGPKRTLRKAGAVDEARQEMEPATSIKSQSELHLSALSRLVLDKPIGAVAKLDPVFSNPHSAGPKTCSQLASIPHSRLEPCWQTASQSSHLVQCRLHRRNCSCERLKVHISSPVIQNKQSIFIYILFYINIYNFIIFVHIISIAIKIVCLASVRAAFAREATDSPRAARSASVTRRACVQRHKSKFFSLSTR